MDKKTFGHDVRALTNTLQTMNVNIEMMEHSLKQIKSLREFITERIDDLHKEAYPLMPDEPKKLENVANV